MAANASTTTNDIGNFMNLYAMLTGRLSGISGTMNVNPDTRRSLRQFAPTPSYFGFKTLGLYAQDSFRVTPQLTLNFGLRWQLDGTIHGTKDIYTMRLGREPLGPVAGQFPAGHAGRQHESGIHPGSAPRTTRI